MLNDIHIDIMDYIVPASCTDTEFRQMWAEFEWENKVSVCFEPRCSLQKRKKNDNVRAIFKHQSKL